MKRIPRRTKWIIVAVVIGLFEVHLLFFNGPLHLDKAFLEELNEMEFTQFTPQRVNQFAMEHHKEDQKLGIIAYLDGLDYVTCAFGWLSPIYHITYIKLTEEETSTDSFRYVAEWHRVMASERSFKNPSYTAEYMHFCGRKWEEGSGPGWEPTKLPFYQALSTVKYTARCRVQGQNIYMDMLVNGNSIKECREHIEQAIRDLYQYLSLSSG